MVDLHLRNISISVPNRKKSRNDKEDSNVPTLCSFGNLGVDARLVSPLPQQNTSDVNYSPILLPLLEMHKVIKLLNFGHWGRLNI